MNNKLRYIIVMVLGIVLNKLLFALAQTLDLPVWLDVAGTALVALTLEPTAGLLVGLLDNFYLAIFEYHDASTLIYYTISAAVALTVGVGMRKEGKICTKRILPVIGIIIVSSAVLSTLLTLWRASGVPSHAWEITFFEHALEMGVPSPLACFWGVLLVKTFDTIASAVIVWLIYRLMPASLRFAPKEKAALPQ